MDFQKINTIIHAIQIQDIGMLAFVAEESFRRAYREVRDISAQRLAVSQHVEISNRIAKMFEESIGVSGIVLQTHETWDGNGYPNKLQGEEICIEARIIYLINYYATSMGAKPVGHERSKEETIEKIKERRGTLFDPELVDKFIEFIQTCE